ncbi:MAG: methyltransferase family protein [Promethearchaeota archaeon]|jgi:protein-S-isoprenylcysteine O-methyltransferase Ste14
MYLIFIISVIGMILIIPFYFWSVEHTKLQERYGPNKGIKLTTTFGLISGWGFFLFLFGIWISPQPKFSIPLLSTYLSYLKIFEFSIFITHLLISLPIIFVGAYYGIVGVKGTTLKVAETHRPEKVISSGIYSKVRHPQYFGAILSHIGITILLSSLFSLLSTPLIIFIIYIFSWKEEKELIREFGEEYEVYKENVPMLLPRIRSKNK